MLARIAGWDGNITAISEETYGRDFTVEQLPGKLAIRTEDKSFEYYSVYSLNGTLLLKETIENSRILIDITSFLRGIYIISLANSQEVVSCKVLIL
jgi:hypothetical protein